MKKLLHTLLLAVLPMGAFAQVTVSTSQYTSEQLINDILFNSSFVTSTNITSKTGTDYASVNGIGYFHNNGTSFPFASGIILSSGDALNAVGTNTGASGNGSQDWLGDADMNAYMTNALGINYNSKNTSVLEFDFVPLQATIFLHYLFASNEYGLYQCSGGDSTAFLIKDITEGTAYQNMALVPNTPTPVSIPTIRNSAYNNNCTSMNAQYFGIYYEDTNEEAPINFKGGTSPMIAKATVIPGHTYHLKIIIADNQDSAFDSAIFIKEGSFEIGDISQNGAEITSSAGIVLCDGSSTTLIAPGNNDYYDYEWNHNGMPLNNNTNILTTDMPGEYSVTISLTGSETITTASISLIEGGGIIDFTGPLELVVYDENNDGIAEFDISVILNQLEAQSSGNEYIISFHQTSEDAEYNLDAIPSMVFINMVPDQQTIYVRIESVFGCFKVISYQVIASTNVPAPIGESTQTLTEGDTLANLEVEGENIQWYDNNGTMPDFPDGTSLPLPLTTLLVDGTTYYASQTINGIESTERFGVTVSLVLGLNNNTLTSLQYYPNPASSILNIENTNGIDTVSVTNTLGQDVMKQTINNNNAQIDVSSLSKDIYFVTITSGSASTTIKIIKE